MTDELLIKNIIEKKGDPKYLSIVEFTCYSLADLTFLIVMLRNKFFIASIQFTIGSTMNIFNLAGFILSEIDDDEGAKFCH